MNEIVNKFYQLGKKFMPEMHLRQPTALDKSGFTYGVWSHLQIRKKEYKNSKKQEFTIYLSKRTR